VNSNILYSIEFLRGLLATTVAICHLYLSQNNNIHLETISSLCVEVFFIISGFVLAPQLIKVFNTNNLINFKIFIIRRFLRTLPAYFFFLVIISLLLNNFLSLNFFKYLFFIQNFFSLNVNIDYYPIAWSLSVEEWFYIIFISFLFLSRKIFKSQNIMFCLLAWFLIFFSFKIIYFSFNDLQFGENLRRITIFRLDTIAIGSIFFIYKELIYKKLKKISYYSLFLLIPFYLFFISNIQTKNILLIETLLVFTHLSSLIILYVFINIEKFFLKFKKFSIFYGKISYSIYLSHLIIIILFNNIFESLSLIILLFYLFIVLVISTLVRKFIEEIFLNLRPNFKF